MAEIGSVTVKLFPLITGACATVDHEPELKSEVDWSWKPVAHEGHEIFKLVPVREMVNCGNSGVTVNAVMRVTQVSPSERGSI